MTAGQGVAGRVEPQSLYLALPPPAPPGCLVLSKKQDRTVSTQGSCSPSLSLCPSRGRACMRVCMAGSLSAWQLGALENYQLGGDSGGGAAPARLCRRPPAALPCVDSQGACGSASSVQSGPRPSVAAGLQLLLSSCLLPAPPPAPGGTES